MSPCDHDEANPTQNTTVQIVQLQERLHPVCISFCLLAYDYLCHSDDCHNQFFCFFSSAWTFTSFQRSQHSTKCYLLTLSNKHTFRKQTNKQTKSLIKIYFKHFSIQTWRSGGLVSKCCRQVIRHSPATGPSDRHLFQAQPNCHDPVIVILTTIPSLLI